MTCGAVLASSPNVRFASARVVESGVRSGMEILRYSLRDNRVYHVEDLARFGALYKVKTRAVSGMMRIIGPSMSKSQESDALGFKRTDAAALVAKSVLGACPYVGPLLAEIVGNVIPNQRLGRLEKFARVLEAQLDEVRRAVFEARLKSAEGVDLLEDVVIRYVMTTHRTTENRLAWSMVFHA